MEIWKDIKKNLNKYFIGFAHMSKTLDCDVNQHAKQHDLLDELIFEK